MKMVHMGCLILALSLISVGAAGDAARVGTLRCEYLENPVGIDVQAPRLSWQIESSERGERQTGYQILVASSAALLDAGQGDLWDSGQVASDQSIQVVYAGSALQSDQRCFWKVRVWNQNQAVSEWSAPAFWSMGLLTPQDWKGQWIGYAASESAREIHRRGFRDCKWIGLPENAPAETGCFRKTFEVPAERKVLRAHIVVAGDPSFTAYINGQEAGKGEGRRNGYVFAVDRFLTAGRNVLSIRVPHTAEQAGSMAARILVEFESGEALSVQSDATWRCSAGAPEGWPALSFDDKKWDRARITGDAGRDHGNRPRMGVSMHTQTIPSPLFRKPFQVSKPVQWACVHVCGLGYHEIYLNGSKVGDHLMDPPATRFDKRALYVTHDVTDRIQPGENAMGVMLGHGWYDMHARDEWDFDAAPWRDTPRLLAQLHVLYADGTTEDWVSDASWKTAPGPVQFDCIRNGEYYDARAEKPGWNTAAYSDGDWSPATLTTAPKGTLRALMAPSAKLTQTIKPVSVTEPKPGIFVFDMGQNMTGWTQLTVSGPAGAVVTLRYDERITADGMLDAQNAIYAHSGEFQTDRYTLKGGGVETWEPRFVYSGFQYVQMEGFPGTPTLESLLGRVVHIDLPPTGEFACSNDLLNRIARNAQWSYLSNYVGYPTDCPHREKNGWTGDAHLAAEQALYTFQPAAAYTKWMNDFKDEQRDNGELPGIVPTSGWGYGIGPSWDSAYLLIPWYMYTYCGDTRILKEHYAGMQRLVAYMDSRAENHIVSYGLGDWVPAKTQTPPAITSTGYYYADTQLLSRIASILGKADDAAHYAQAAETIKNAFNEKFYTMEKGTYGTQTALGCALYHGLVAEGQEDRIAQMLENAVMGEGKHLDGGILGSKYVPRALANSGRADLVYAMAAQTTFPSWGHWLEQGATTLWENWNGESSRNHIMFGDIVALFYSMLAGIQPDPENPGFHHILLQPQPCGDLTWVRASSMTPYGPVRSEWERQGTKFQWRACIPANTSATVYLPAAQAESATEGGAPLVSMQGAISRKYETNRWVLELGAGEYHFASVLPE